MALRTNGFALSALPQAPSIPTNIGKVDTKGILDSVVGNLRAQDEINMGAQRALTERATMDTQNAQALATQKRLPFATNAGIAEDVATQRRLPSETQAKIAVADRTSALAAPDIVSGERRNALSGLEVDQAKNQNALGDQQTLNAMGGPGRLVFSKFGPPTNSTASVTRVGPDYVSKETKTANVGGAEVPIATETSTAPAVPTITPITGAGGLPGGNVVTSVGPDGKPQTHVIQAPLAALNNLVAESRWVKTGSVHDNDTGNVQDVYQQQTRSASGGDWVNHGAAVKTTAGSGPPGTNTSGAAAPSFLSKDALKAIDDAQSEVATLSTRKLELENISNAAENMIKSNLGAGRVAGPLQRFLGLAPAQEFVGSVQNALQTALQPLRGTGRVSNTEFNQALSALPKIDDQPETIQAKLHYLNLATDWALSRQQSYLEGLGSGLNRYQAFQKAQKDTPIPEVPNFYSGHPQASSSGAPATPGGAQISRKAFGSEADAEAAAARGELKAGDPITVNGVNGKWH